VAQVLAALEAAIEMGRRPGLRADVHGRLLKVLEAALEVAKSPGDEVDQAAPLVLCLDEYEVTYSLDLLNARVHVLAIERFEARPARQDAPSRA